MIGKFLRFSRMYEKKKFFLLKGETNLKILSFFFKNNFGDNWVF
jgi:hypothetical protein